MNYSILATDVTSYLLFVISVLCKGISFCLVWARSWLAAEEEGQSVYLLETIPSHK